jgi:hypothetical protein
MSRQRAIFGIFGPVPEDFQKTTPSWARRGLDSPADRGERASRTPVEIGEESRKMVGVLCGPADRIKGGHRVEPGRAGRYHKEDFRQRSASSAAGSVVYAGLLIVGPCP